MTRKELELKRRVAKNYVSKKKIQDHYNVSGYSYKCASYLGRKQQDFII